MDQAGQTGRAGSIESQPEAEPTPSTSAPSASAPSAATTGDRLPIEFEVKPTWTIEGEVPPGLATCLLVSAMRPGWEGPVRIDVAADGAIGPGPAMLTVNQPNGPAGRSTSAVLTSSARGRLTASMSAADPDDLNPSQDLEPTRWWPEDVPPFIGGRPGPAALCEVRPLPGPNGEPLSTDAWVRPTRAGGGARPELLAIDAWLAASQLAFLQQNANDPGIERLPKASWSGATFVLDLSVEPSTESRWYLRRTTTTDRLGSMDEVGAIEVADRGDMRPCVSFELRRPPNS